MKKQGLIEKLKSKANYFEIANYEITKEDIEDILNMYINTKELEEEYKKDTSNENLKNSLKENYNYLYLACELLFRSMYLERNKYNPTSNDLDYYEDDSLQL